MTQYIDKETFRKHIKKLKSEKLVFTLDDGSKIIKDILVK